MKKNHYKFSARAAGFTLVEMLVSTGIIAMLSTIFLANYHTYGTKGNLNMAAQKLASDIRQAQSYALGLKEFSAADPMGWWGISATKQQPNNNRYLIFADLDPWNLRQDNGEVKNTIMLPKNILISNILYDGSALPPGQNLAITFEPPDPKIRICKNTQEDQCANNDAEIILEDNSGNTVSVIVNTLGLVDVQH